MKIPVLLTIRSEQCYEGQDPDHIELVTEGTLEELGENSWRISYEETALTGLQGVTTTFHMEPGKVVLRRDGGLRSEMIFQENVCNETLYQMEFGALMIGICAHRIRVELSCEGGSIEVFYGVRIEKNQAGTILYHIEVKTV